MKAAFETLDRLWDVKDCPDVDENATTIMAPLFRGTLSKPEGHPKTHYQYRKYERTTEIYDGYPLFREVPE